jgi:hypothetical protein
MVASRQFFCHKVILAAQSKFFAKLFKEKVLVSYSSKTTTPYFDPVTIQPDSIS